LAEGRLSLEHVAYISLCTTVDGCDPASWIIRRCRRWRELFFFRYRDPYPGRGPRPLPCRTARDRGAGTRSGSSWAGGDPPRGSLCAVLHSMYGAARMYADL